LIAIAGFVELVNNWRQYVGIHGGAQFTPGDGDVVFDCGACIGDITTLFAGMIGNQGRVHSFDPVPLHNRFLSLQMKENPELSDAFVINQLAVGKSTKMVNSGSKGDEEKIVPGGLGIDRFAMCSLDDYCDENNVSRIDMIKMDIEGAEADALAGAQRVVQEFNPNLAISVYHKPDDIWSLPLQIKKLHPEYRLSFSHHSPLAWESVVYAHDPDRA
jgi:FkbM family methyltransferase